MCCSVVLVSCIVTIPNHNHNTIWITSLTSLNNVYFVFIFFCVAFILWFYGQTTHLLKQVHEAGSIPPRFVPVALQRAHCHLTGPLGCHGNHEHSIVHESGWRLHRNKTDSKIFFYSKIEINLRAVFPKTCWHVNMQWFKGDWLKLSERQGWD